MIIVSTKEELKQALERRETKIVATGDLARDMRSRMKSRRRVKKGMLIGGVATAAAGIVAIPFTGGASAGLTAAGLTAAGLTFGTLTISGAELAILCGFALSMYGLKKGCKVKFNKDGSAEIEPKYR